MQRRFNWRHLLVPIAVAALVASCGSDDDATVVEPAVSTPSDGSVDAPTDNTTDLPSDEGAGSCSEIFSDDEIEEFFGEPTDLTEDDNEAIGLLATDFVGVGNAWYM